VPSARSSSLAGAKHAQIRLNVGRPLVAPVVVRLSARRRPARLRRDRERRAGRFSRLVPS